MSNFWDEEPEPRGDYEIQILSVAVAPEADGSYRALVHSSRGDIAAQLSVCEGGLAAAIFAGGAAGGLGGPANNLYHDLAQDLHTVGVSSLRLQYRQPGEFEECVLDVLGCVSLLKGIGAERVVLVGHSFGGAVVIKAGQLAEAVVAVAALSSQLYGTADAASLAPRPLLLVHGLDDQVLEATASQVIYDRAVEPKQIVLYEGAGHSLLQCREELRTLLCDWVGVQARPPAAL